MEQTRTIRIKKINPFLLNNGIVLKKNFIIIIFLTFELILTLTMLIDYQFLTKNNKDFFETLNSVGGDIFILNRYFLLHYIDNLLIGTINSYITDLKNINITVPYFYDYINYQNFKLNLWGYITIILSFIITIFIYLLTIFQIREQQKYRSIGLHSIYSPLILILFSRFLKEYHFLKRVEGIKRDSFNIDKKREIIQLFFNKNKIFLNNNIKDIDIKIETFGIFHGFYIIYRLSIFLKPTKK